MLKVTLSKFIRKLSGDGHKYSAYCFGVQNALEIAENAAKDGEVYTFGDLIHNEQVLNDLEKKNVKSSIDLPFLCSKNRVIIRAHGVAPDVLNMLKTSCKCVYDATCPFVKKTQEIVKNYYNKGYKIIILGNKNHAEVEGLNGYAGGHALVAENYDDLPDLTTSNYCLVAQTTFSSEKYESIVKNIKKQLKDNLNIVEFFDTICYTTKARQIEAEVLSKSNQLVLVLGSKISSNTNKLFEIAKRFSEKAVLIESVSDLLSVEYIKYNTMAVMAAASAPQELIEEVLIYMSETQKAEVVSAEDTTPVAEVVEATIASAADKAETMADLMASNKGAGFLTYKAGKRITAEILNIDDSGIFVGIGGKKDGFIDKADASIDGYNPADFTIGDKIDAIIIPNKTKDYISLSKKDVDIRKLADAEAEKALQSNEFSIICSEVVPGKGLRGKLGSYTVFVPASQIRIGFVKNLEEYTSKKLRLRALPPKEPKEGEEVKKSNGKFIVASQRVILEQEKAEKEEAFWSTMVEDAIVPGKVKRFSTFGAFVSVKGFDCLAHISDLSWNKIDDPSKVLTIGETYDFKILKIDREAGKISLGYKQLQKTPYELAAEKYPVGSVIKGKVERIKSYGAFIAIDEGVDGLVHVSQLSHEWTKDANERLKIGDEIEAKIIGFEDNRITLSIKELLPLPVVEAEPVEEEVESSDKPKRVIKGKKMPEYSEVKAKTEENRASRRTFKREETNEPHSWQSDTGAATIGDLFGDLKNFKFDEDETK